MSNDELQKLKQRADMLGITYSPNIGLAKLKAKVNDALAENTDDNGYGDTTPSKAPKELTLPQKRALKRKEASRLVRCRITCMNPNKRDHEGEILAVGNQFFTFKKFVLFNTDYHLPKILLDNLKERQCQIFIHAKDSKGNKTMKGKLIKEYGIEILDPLTPDELNDIKQRQLATKSIDE